MSNDYRRQAAGTHHVPCKKLLPQWSLIQMFALLGIGVLFYTACAIVNGQVYAKSGLRGRTVSREESPRYFWMMIVIYTGLGVALLTVF